MAVEGLLNRLIGWFDEQLGFRKTPLKPVPEYVLNPAYWLGALLAVTFVLQGITGAIQLIYYIPTPDQAYSSTSFVIQNVPYGWLVETLHLYTAYAMILLMVMHGVRNYFSSLHKGRRKLMWMAGILMMAVVLSYGVTGYLLPWTVISKSATDVALGFLGFLPSGLREAARFLVAGSGSDADELRHFFGIHVMVLPMTLLAFLAAKIYMYEVHGPSYTPAFGRGKSVYIGWFPRVFLYALVLTSIYVGALFTVAALFPLQLPPGFTAAGASGYVVQPDWYLLWLYQVLKFEAFEGGFATLILGGLGVAYAALLFLPFIDRSRRIYPGDRPLFATLGIVALAEIVALTVWGYLTPGQVIPNIDAVVVVGGVAVATTLCVLLYYSYHGGRVPMLQTPASQPQPVRALIAFIILLSVASASLSALISPVGAFTSEMFPSAIIAGVSVSLMVWLVKRTVTLHEQAVGR